MTPHSRVLAARARTEAARTRMMATFSEVQTRLTPRSLTQEAVETATQGAAKLARSSAEIVRSRPLAIAALVGGIGAFFARKAIARAVMRRDKPDDATGHAPTSLKQRRRHRARKGKHHG